MHSSSLVLLSYAKAVHLNKANTTTNKAMNLFLFARGFVFIVLVDLRKEDKTHTHR